MDNLIDPLGFTKKTAMILRGLGQSGLIPECRKRNISTPLLHELFEEDLVTLGADPKQASEVRKALSVVKQRDKQTKLSDEERIADFPDIIADNEKQLALLQLHAAYTKLKLDIEQIDCFVDPDIPLTASQVLQDTAEATLREIAELEIAISDFEAINLKDKTQSGRYQRYLVLLSAAALMTFVWFKLNVK